MVRGVMNISSIRQILWSTRQTRRVTFEQLELPLPSARITAQDAEVLAMLRKLKKKLAEPA